MNITPPHSFVTAVANSLHSTHAGKETRSFLSYLKEASSQESTAQTSTQATSQSMPTNHSSSGGDMGALLLMLAQQKSLNQIVERLKETPHYLEQIAYEQEQQRKLTRHSNINENQAIYAIKGSDAYFEDIMQQSQESQKLHSQDSTPKV